MKTEILELEPYCKLEGELCVKHRDENEDLIDSEWESLKELFRAEYPTLIEDEDYGFGEWHHKIRMLWIYLYHDSFYDSKFIKSILRILHSTESDWFAQFECYSPALESGELPTGAIGTFIVTYDKIIFDDCERWLPKLEKMKV